MRFAFRFSIVIGSLLVVACTSSSSSSQSRNPAACPSSLPTDGRVCFTEEDGGVFACLYACGPYYTGSVQMTCDGSRFHETASDCVADKAFPRVGPIACGDTTCAADEYCTHECCDETPCTSFSVEADGGGCPAGSHAVPEGGGECSGGCIDDHPECLPKDYCSKGTPPSDCSDRYCADGCD